ncbi:hypothetical protein OG21DRAFT_1505165 [Imleria badia]|nr:hypothetical protein OG21DRAFT_1505165 [Imleria badia]
MGRRAYHAALFHLMVLNFPYALIAWIYLFVFTLVSLGGGPLPAELYVLVADGVF